eukprot:1392005-Amorphochlora_amoeboformis.AAC.2
MEWELELETERAQVWEPSLRGRETKSLFSKHKMEKIPLNLGNRKNSFNSIMFTGVSTGVGIGVGIGVWIGVGIGVGDGEGRRVGS